MYCASGLHPAAPPPPPRKTDVCGICGFVGEGSAEPLQAMADRLRHRGPDEAGYFREGPVGLAIRRLSVIDPQGGSQPLFNEDGNLVLVFNGEIYNHEELRGPLERRGHHLKTHSDGEVILHLFEESGPDCLRHLNGMFAIALWDRRRGELFLARDRLGIKPLYYSLQQGQWVFASEIKALLAHPAIGRQLDRTALDQYLTFEYVPGPRSIFQGIHKLLPGHWLLGPSRHGLRPQRYWSVDYQPSGQTRDPQEWQEELSQKLRQAVRRQLISDVPLGAFLSGGLDSSSIVACMVEASAQTIKTFSIGFAERSFDESRYAREVARHLATDHHEYRVSPQEILEVIPTVGEILDEPLGDASILPTYLVSRFARQSVTVVLSGDGGDELLAGYPTYLAAHWAEAVRKLPRAWLRAARWLAEGLPSSTANWSLDYKIKRFLSRLEFEPEERNILWVGSFSPEEKQAIYGPGMAGLESSTFEPLTLAGRCQRQLPLLQRLLYLDLNFYLVDDLLVKLDRASMAVSLEGRVPMLDHELVEFLARVPGNLKLSGWTSKALLKRAMRSRLPHSIIDRPKKGFGIPVAEWIKGPLKTWMLDHLTHDELKKDDLFQPTGVDRLLREHFSGSKDHRKQLWTLVNFISWRRRFLEA